MGQYTFDNLDSWQDFAQKAQPGDIVIVGQNFGCGSSRQQAVDCFKSLGIQLIIAKSFGAIYERNAINNALPIMTANIDFSQITDGDSFTVNLKTGVIITSSGREVQGTPFSDVQMQIYKRGGLL